MTSSLSAHPDTDLTRIESPYRPLPLGAKEKLQDAAEEVQYCDDGRIAFVSTVPSDTVLTEYELTVVQDESPTSVWHTQHGDTIEVFDDRIELNGSEMNLPRTEILEKLQSQARFTETATHTDSTTPPDK